MLRNISYNDHKLKEEISKIVGEPFSFFERIKMNGIGSSSLRIQGCNSEVENLFNLDNNDNRCNIEIRKKGIIVRFRALLETYALIIPFYKLKLFKGDSNVYSIYIDNYYIKVLANNKNVHDFFKKISKYRNSS
jgi:hypothetical protein|tara:strand:+ start:10813 stop:11214 length:402 start_codon:yes stop_codon:yes gene_type:complete